MAEDSGSLHLFLLVPSQNFLNPRKQNAEQDLGPTTHTLETPYLALASDARPTDHVICMYRDNR